MDWLQMSPPARPAMHVRMSSLPPRRFGQGTGLVPLVLQPPALETPRPWWRERRWMALGAGATAIVLAVVALSVWIGIEGSIHGRARSKVH